MSQFLASLAFWSLLAVPVVFWSRSFYRRTADSRRDSGDIRPGEVPECTALCSLIVLVIGGFAFDVLPRLYGVLMEAAK